MEGAGLSVGKLCLGVGATEARLGKVRLVGVGGHHGHHQCEWLVINWTMGPMSPLRFVQQKAREVPSSGMRPNWSVGDVCFLFFFFSGCEREFKEIEFQNEERRY